MKVILVPIIVSISTLLPSFAHAQENPTAKRWAYFMIEKTQSVLIDCPEALVKQAAGKGDIPWCFSIDGFSLFTRKWDLYQDHYENPVKVTPTSPWVTTKTKGFQKDYSCDECKGGFVVHCKAIPNDPEEGTGILVFVRDK